MYMKKLFSGTLRFLHTEALKAHTAHIPDKQVTDCFDNITTSVRELQKELHATLAYSSISKLTDAMQKIQDQVLEAKKLYCLQELHKALAINNFELASKYLTLDNLHSQNEYGDTPITLAIAEQQWKFLSIAKQYATTKVKCPETLYSIVNSEHDEQLQCEMIGQAEHFYILNDAV